MTTRSPSRFTTVRTFWYRTMPPCFVSCFDCTVMRAVPPMWNVRIVSCVPGSPIDWAAMMPTASPSSTSRPAARFRP